MMKSAQEEEQDALQAASNVYELVMENDRVRLLRAVFKPGAKAAMHHHPDHAVYVVKGGKIQLVSPSGEIQTLDLEPGKALFLEAQSHEATNLGNGDIELLVVEL